MFGTYVDSSCTFQVDEQVTLCHEVKLEAGIHPNEPFVGTVLAAYHNGHDEMVEVLWHGNEESYLERATDLVIW